MSIFIGSIPNTQEDDLKLTKEILSGQIDTTNSIQDLTSQLKKILDHASSTNIFLFNRGRDSLYFFLNLLGLKKDDEVLTQAFTCVAVVAPILWNGCKPMFVDIDPNTFNMDLNLLKQSINERTKAIIVQHTFGNIANVKKVREIVDELNSTREESRKIYIIEDCAHIFPLNNPLRGRYSDAYFFSFSQDKGISCTQGAMINITNSKVAQIAKERYKEIVKPNNREAIYNAKYIKLWSVIKRYYFKKLIPLTNITIGRALIIIYRSLGLIKKQANTDTLLLGEIKKMSNIQACLLLNQLRKVDGLNNHREEIVNIYDQTLKQEFRFLLNNNDNGNNKLLLRYPILVSNKVEIKKRLLDKKIIVGNWYSSPVFPLKEDKQLKRVNFSKKNCPVAEKVRKNILNLPTNIEVTKDEAKKIAYIINNFAKPINI